MADDTLSLVREETFAVITLNRPPANAISEALMRELNAALYLVDVQHRVADATWLQDVAERNQRRRDIRLERRPVPRRNGPFGAVGVGRDERGEAVFLRPEPSGNL